VSRKPSATLQYKLRIREALRRRIEQAAKGRPIPVSANYEMVSRLEQSFEKESLWTLAGVAADMSNIWDRYGKAIDELNKQGDLIRAVEALLKLPAKADAADREDAVANVQRVITGIKAQAAEIPRRMRTTGAAT
jgi:hypothetical protein